MNLRRWLIFVLGLTVLLAGTAAQAAEGSGPPAAEKNQDGAATLPPQAATTPLPPGQLPSFYDDSDELLLKHLDELIAERDRKIAGLPLGAEPSLATSHRTPRIDPRDPQAQEALTQHAAARVILRQALEDAAARSGQGETDVLDRGRPRSQAAQLGPLAAVNQLAIAECYKDLAATVDGSALDVTAGLAALAAIDATHLTDSERPRHLYLTLWFQLDQVRKMPPDAPANERARLVKIAYETRSDLANQFPTSALSQTAEALFSGIDGARALNPTPSPAP